jgi:hypothetical protein
MAHAFVKPTRIPGWRARSRRSLKIAYGDRLGGEGGLDLIDESCPILGRVSLAGAPSRLRPAAPSAVGVG